MRGSPRGSTPTTVARRGCALDELIDLFTVALREPGRLTSGQRSLVRLMALTLAHDMRELDAQERAAVRKRLGIVRAAALEASAS